MAGTGWGKRKGVVRKRNTFKLLRFCGIGTRIDRTPACRIDVYLLETMTPTK